MVWHGIVLSGIGWYSTTNIRILYSGSKAQYQGVLKDACAYVVFGGLCWRLFASMLYEVSE